MDWCMDREMFLKYTGISSKIVDGILSKNGRDESYLYCGCGMPKKVIKVSNKHIKDEPGLLSHCGDRRCSPNFGKKRPEHSAYMKNLASSGENALFSDTLIKQGTLFNKEVNTVEFKRIKLRNKGLSVDNRSYEEVEHMNSMYESEKHFDRKLFFNRLQKLIEKNNLHERFCGVTQESVQNMSVEEFKNIRYKFYSWHHAIYCEDNCGAKYFKRIVKDNIKFHNRNFTTVVTRSSYESNYIDFFEKNGITWDYEPFRIDLVVCTYKPDFVFQYDDIKYILETKGFLLEKDKRFYLTTKINGGFDYAKNNGYGGMIFSYDSSPSTIYNLINQQMKEKF